VQAVEYFVEWALSPTNAVFLRVQTGVYDPSLVGDKSKWFSHLLAHKLFQVYDETSSLAAALETQTSAGPAADDNRTGQCSLVVTITILLIFRSTPKSSELQPLPN